MARAAAGHRSTGRPPCTASAVLPLPPPPPLACRCQPLDTAPAVPFICWILWIAFLGGWWTDDRSESGHAWPRPVWCPLDPATDSSCCAAVWWHRSRTDNSRAQAIARTRKLRPRGHAPTNDTGPFAFAPSLLSFILLLCCLVPSGHSQIALIGSLPAYDVTTHVGTPENPPPPGIEYLGAGYDLVFGNPLDEQGEAFMDPGFRLPAIELLFDVRRTAGSFQEPLGTSIKRGPACKYATLAQEVASVSAYQQLLALDVTTLNEFGILTSVAAAAPVSSSTGAAGGTTGADGFVVVDPIVADAYASNGAASSTGAAGGGYGPGGGGGNGGGGGGDGEHGSDNKGCYRSRHKVGGPPTTTLSTAFVGSFGFLDARQNLEQKDQIAFYSRALCVEYMVEFRSFIPPLLTENFSNGIAFLPDFAPNESDLSDRAADARTRYRAFIAEFGTHYIHRMVAGGKRVVTTLLSASSVASLRNQNVNVALGAAFIPGIETWNGTIPTAFSGTNFTIQSQQNNFESMSAQIESRIETTIGGIPFINFYGWAATVPDRTTPIQYTLKPLYALLPSGDKRAALKTVLTAYLNSAGKYPSVDNRATFAGSLSQEAPPPTPVYNNAPRTGTTTVRSPSQASNTPGTPATTLSPIGPVTIPNRLPAGPGGQYPVSPSAPPNLPLPPLP